MYTQMYTLQNIIFLTIPHVVHTQPLPVCHDTQPMNIMSSILLFILLLILVHILCD